MINVNNYIEKYSIITVSFVIHLKQKRPSNLETRLLGHHVPVAGSCVIISNYSCKG